MRFPVPLFPATLVRRYKRFLADVVLPSGETVTVHCANPGSMIGLDATGARVWLSKSANPNRKLAHSWELIEVDLGGGAELVGINTVHPNALAAEAIAAGAVAELAGYASVRREVKYGKNSRVDFLLEAPARPPCYVEIKNVHLMRQPGLAEFPDAVTKRGAKHLVELGAMAAAGARAVMLFLIQIGSARRFKLARDIDPAYGAAFDAARAMGVEAIAYRCGISCEGIEVAEPVALAPQRKTGQIKLHGAAAFEGMRKAGRLVAECLDMLAGEIGPGVPTEKVDRLVFDFALAHKATPATLMYRGYRKATCTSVNHVVCHGIPGEKPLKEGDIVNVDVTLILDGWHGDSSRMYAVGAIPRRAERLIEVTYEAMMRGISVIRPGATTGDIGAAIQSYVEAQHMSVVRDFCGHGVGRLFHDEPNIVHVGRPGEGIVLRPGMFFTVEPMINLGRPHVKVLSDGWTAVTRDRSLSAQFEHTVAVTESGVEIFTLSPRGLDRPHSSAASRP